jgi:hypothetical protein
MEQSRAMDGTQLFHGETLAAGSCSIRLIRTSPTYPKPIPDALSRFGRQEAVVLLDDFDKKREVRS